jgi:hypothetical protein
LNHVVAVPQRVDDTCELLLLLLLLPFEMKQLGVHNVVQLPVTTARHSVPAARAVLSAHWHKNNDVCSRVIHRSSRKR